MIIWEKLVTEEMLKSLVDQTCLYADQYLATHTLAKRSRVQQWMRKPFTIDELRKFFALVIVMGLVNYPRLEDYWATSWPFATHTFSSVMSRDRFSLILRFLHINDSAQYIPKGQPGYDAIYKVRPFLTSLLRQFKSNFTPQTQLSIDESMIGFKGRLSFIQYLPKKPTKWGLKAFVLADSNTGYTMNWRLYTGM